MAQLRDSSVVGACELMVAPPPTIEDELTRGFPHDLDPALAATLERERAEPAWGAFCAFRGQQGCCHEAGADELAELASPRAITSLEIGLRTYPERDILRRLAQQPELARTLTELTILLETGGGRPEPDRVDLEPLGQLPALRRLTIAGIGSVVGVASLLSHPSLVELDVGWVGLSATDRELLRGQQRIAVQWDAAASRERHERPACPQIAHDRVRETTEAAPEGHVFTCGWPFPE